MKITSGDLFALAKEFRAFDRGVVLLDKTQYSRDLGWQVSQFFDYQPVNFSRSFDTPCKFRVHLEGVQFEARFIFACTGYIQRAF